MELPNGENAQIDVDRKLIGYCLNVSHRTGRHKARVFTAVLGITSANVEILAEGLRRAAVKGNAKLKGRTADAAKYEIDFLLGGPRGSALVRSG